MPLPISHGLLGATIVAALHPQPQKRYFTPLFIGAFLANAADLDFLLVFFFHDKSWHRSFSHSVLFTLIVFLFSWLMLGRKRIREAIVYGLAFASHGILDFVTTKVGGGVELLWPFSAQRLALGWVGLSEVPSKLAAVEIIKALIIEVALFAPIFMLVLFISRWMVRKGGRLAARGAI